MTSLKIITGFLVALLFTSPAQAIIINSAGDSWGVDWNATTVKGYNLSATSTWSVTSFSATEIALTIGISNTTMLSGSLTNADITSFGFGIAPNATATLVNAGTVFDMVGVGKGAQQTFPGGFKNIDVCLFADGCAGGNVNNGLAAGSSDIVSILLLGDFSGGSATLMPFPLKFQTSNGSYEPGGVVSAPAPAVLGIMGIGLMGMLFSSGLRYRKIS